MRKLSDIKGEDALDVLAKLLEPMIEISMDAQFVLLVRTKDKIGAVKYLLENHKEEIIAIMAIIEGEDPEKYQPSLVKLPSMLLELFNDPELLLLFQSQGTVTSSGSVMENTEETETKSQASSATRKPRSKKK